MLIFTPLATIPYGFDCVSMTPIHRGSNSFLSSSCIGVVSKPIRPGMRKSRVWPAFRRFATHPENVSPFYPGFRESGMSNQKIILVLLIKEKVMTIFFRDALPFKSMFSRWGEFNGYIFVGEMDGYRISGAERTGLVPFERNKRKCFSTVGAKIES